MTERRITRCAIYTRKSTEEGLEQEFNSLDAQREACAAYILSQRHEGWVEIPEQYDDGGFSGGNMERPGLKRLMADMAAGKVDAIVVYKVDRLTRALTDFARIVEVLDAKGASFVSVTQALNSTTSMGRLTLNVLLSFAQFEREVTGERIRDKIAASKRKGMFMGGPVPIGYDVCERKLVVNEAEAATVRHIFERYAMLGSGLELIEGLRADGYRTKLRLQGNRTVGGIPFERGVLFHILGNPIYVGKVVHQGVEYDGEHAALIDLSLWRLVQERLAANRVSRGCARNSHTASLLAGIIVDGHGRRMTPSHASKAGKRYRYYVTPAAELRPGQQQAWRMPATDLETAVVRRVAAYFGDHRQIAALAGIGTSAATISALLDEASRITDRLTEPSGRKAVLGRLLRKVTIANDEVVIELDAAALSRMLGIAIDDRTSISLTTAATKVRAGKATRLVLSDDRTKPSRDPRLISLLAEAQAARAFVLANPDRSIREIAAERRCCRHRLVKLVRLSWIAPEIITAVIEGRQPTHLTPRRLLEHNWPLAWSDQAEAPLSPLGQYPRSLPCVPKRSSRPMA